MTFFPDKTAKNITDAALFEISSIISKNCEEKYLYVPDGLTVCVNTSYSNRRDSLSRYSVVNIYLEEDGTLFADLSNPAEKHDHLYGFNLNLLEAEQKQKILNYITHKFYLKQSRPSREYSYRLNSAGV